MTEVSHSSVYICELKLDRAQKQFYASGHHISRVGLLGTVTYCSIKDNVHVFYIDDGTGTLPCIHFQSPSSQKPSVVSPNQLASVPSIVSDLYNHSLTARKYSPKLGDCLSVKGKLNIFRDSPQLIIYELRLVSNMNEWWFRVLEIQATQKARRRIHWKQQTRS